jgi:predicted DNA-binding transcriptional regulator YafY
MSQESRDGRWHVIRRCLVMIRRLQRGPADRKELIEAVQAEIHDAYAQTEDSSRQRQFERDILHLKEDLNLDVKCDRQTNLYFLYESDYPLLDLPDEDLNTIAWLRQTFDAASPQHHAVNGFLSRIISFLDPHRREVVEAQRLSFKLDLSRRDDNHIPEEVKSGIARALTRGVRVEFEYSSSENESGMPRRHTVDPYEYFFDNGHYYLKGWCHSVREEGQEWSIGSYNAYRLDSMSNFQILPSKTPWPPPRAKKHAIRYWLDAPVVRRGVSRQRWIDFIDPDDIEWQPDGSAIVNGTTDQDFFAVQALLRYGERCQVLNEGLVKQRILETLKKMVKNYELPTN